jgi:PAS domain S-box-containing protein
LSQLAKDIVEHPERYLSTVNENIRSNGERVWVSWTNRAVVDEMGRVREILAIGNDITDQKRMEDALRASEERFRAVFESSSDCILVWDRQYNYLYANQAAIDHVGTTRDKVIGKNIRDGLGHVPDFMQLWMGRVDRSFDTGESFRVVDAVPVGDRLIYSESQVSPIRDAAGQVFAVGVVYRDVTERKRAEEALQQSERRFREMAETVPDILFTAQPDGSMDYVNERGLIYVGLTAGEVIGDGWSNVVHPQDVEQSVRAVAESVRTGRPYELKQRLRAADGSYRWFMARAHAIRDEKGDIQKWLGTATDIEDLLQTQEELQQSRIDLDRAQEVGQIGWWRLDTRQNVLMWSDENHRIFGVPVGTRLTYETFLGSVHPEDRRYVDTQWQAGLRGEPYEIEHRIVVNEQIKWVREKAYLDFDDTGGLLGGFGITQDITERKRAEADTVRLASFPKLNPNPVIETDFEGNVYFLNPAAQALFPDLPLSRLEHPFFANWGEFTLEFREGVVKVKEREAMIDGHHYHQTILFVEETQRFRIYGIDITGLKRAEEDLKDSNRRLEILAETASRLLISGRPQMIVNELCRKIMAHLDCQVFFNYLVDEQRDRLRLNAWDGISEETAQGMEWLDFGVAVCGCAAREGRRIVAEHIPDTQDPRTDLVCSFGIKAYACHPLMSQGRVIGTLSFGTRTRPTFTEDELALMRAVTDQVSMAIERMRYIEDLKTAREDLQQSHDALESRVRERTEELWRTIARLETEAAERQRAEEALHESREKLYNTLESITDGFMTLDRSWRFTYLNREAEKIWRKKREELIGKTLWEITPVAVGTVFEEQYRKAMFDHISVSFEALSPMLKVWIEVRAYPTAEGIAIYARDISKRKKAEEALRLATAYNRSLIEASPDPLVTIDPDGRISDVNAATENATGYSREDLVGTDFSDYFTEPEMARKGYRLVFQEGAVRDYALEIRHRNGQVTPVLYNATVYRDEAGKVVGVFAAARDISRQREVEKKLRESNEQLRALTSELVMAEERARRRIAVDLHDHVSQSLAVAKLRLETLQERASESGLLEPVREVRDLINESIQQTRSLITDLSPSILYELGFNAAVEWLTEQVKTKHGVTIDLMSDLKIKRLDQDVQVLLFQTLRELLINIVKHAKTNQASVTIREIGDYIRIRVMDDGVGFDKARLTNGIAHEGGFGLFSIRERLEHLGGRLTIHTGPGKGTSVTIEAPHRKIKKAQRRVRHVH